VASDHQSKLASDHSATHDWIRRSCHISFQDHCSYECCLLHNSKKEKLWTVLEKFPFAKFLMSAFASLIQSSCLKDTTETVLVCATSIPYTTTHVQMSNQQDEFPNQQHQNLSLAFAQPDDIISKVLLDGPHECEILCSYKRVAAPLLNYSSVIHLQCILLDRLHDLRIQSTNNSCD